MAVASPFGAHFLASSSSHVRNTDTTSAAIPTKIAQVALASMPDIVIPVKELTGLNLPDLHLSDLKKIKLPDKIPLPDGLFPAPTPGDTSAPVQLGPDQLPSGVSDLGATVKEITRDSPFSMIALTAKSLSNSVAHVRVRLPDGTWGPWVTIDPLMTGGSDKTGPNGIFGTEPVYVGDTNAVQVLISHPVSAPVPPPAPAPAAAPLGYRPAAFSQPLRTDSDNSTANGNASANDGDPSITLIQPGTSPDDGNLDQQAQPLPGGGPRVITRAQWGADESIRCQGPTYDDGLGGAVIHDTATSNDYSKADSAGIVRAIYAYHAQTLGWCDIGYNAVVDKYGQIFEGRYGGLDKNVEGAHAGGFNENTVGVSMIGNFDSVAPSDAQLQSVGQFLGWRLKLANLDPKGHTTMYSEGTSYTPYKEGEAVNLPIIFAHRDVDNTDCPGDAAYTKMDEIRDLAAKYASGSGDPTTGLQQKAGGAPLSGPMQALADLAKQLQAKSNAPVTPPGDAPAPPAPPAAPAPAAPPAPPVPTTAAAAPAPADPPAAPAPAAPPPAPEQSKLGDGPNSLQPLLDVAKGFLQANGMNPVAQRWVATGAENGPLGKVESPLLPAKEGQHYAKFANGYVFTSSSGKTIVVAGKILEKFIEMGLDASKLGLPLAEEYVVPEGMRADFEHGSLIFNQATGFVTTLLNTYTSSYDQAYNSPTG
ncbi:N-acetylmuramoyl-L-alanine amidase [Skermania sp. ID1734]|uniref:N-acetylmuramoyl-L-alanine amidase n=1 Tax=Skermania sp. ID1734 TaxID=2597516 RepID=UPI00210391C0|nr:N-acetylmuramoyl-L-alanine amidase [Skermania sp. ID1734]